MDATHGKPIVEGKVMEENKAPELEAKSELEKQSVLVDETGDAVPITDSVTSSLKEESPRQLHGWKWALAYGSMLSTTFLFALDYTIVADIQPAILGDFGQVELLPWIGVGFAVGTMTILPWSKVYGVFNIKWIYIFNMLLFEIGSVICGASPNVTVLIIARVIAACHKR